MDKKRGDVFDIQRKKKDLLYSASDWLVTLIFRGLHELGKELAS